MKSLVHQILKLTKDIYTSKNLPFAVHEPVFIGNEKKYLNDAIDSTFVSSVGKYVNDFETEFSKYTGIKHSISVVNGTSALQISLLLSGVKNGHEVITQSLTFVATANAISYLGATPIFVDVDIDTMGMSPESLQTFLVNNAKIIDGECINIFTGKIISCCVPMNTFGVICRLDEIKKICDKWCISLVEDSAEAAGSFFNNKSSGSFGKISAFSFNGNKIITTGGGGMICTNDDTIALKAKHITTTAKVKHQWDFYHDEIGYNFRMPNINAALGLAQLEQIDNFINNKKEIFNIYKNFFDKKGLQFYSPPKNIIWNHWLFSLILDNPEDKNLFLKISNESKILCRPIWNLMHKLPMYKNCQSSDLKNSIFLENRVVNLISSTNF